MGTILPDHSHLYADYSKGVDSQGPYVLAQYYFDDYADSNAVLDALKGTVTRVGDSTFRSLPHQHELYPWLFCVSARCVGLGPPRKNAAGLPDYAGGFTIEAEYRSGVGEAIPAPGGQENAHQIDPADPILWCTQELDFATEAVVVPSHSYKWLGDNTLAEVPVKVEVPLITCVLTFHRLPYLPMTRIRQKVGKTNSDRVLGANAGTILFPGARTTREVSTDGTIVQKVQLVFKEKPTGWNTFLRKDKFVWDTLVDAQGRRPYQSTTFRELLTL